MVYKSYTDGSDLDWRDPLKSQHLLTEQVRCLCVLTGEVRCLCVLTGEVRCLCVLTEQVRCLCTDRTGQVSV